LRQTLSRLHETLLASRDRLEQHLSRFPEHLLYEAWEQSQQVARSRQARTSPQLALDLTGPGPRPSPAPDAPPFQAAERPGEYRLLRPVTVDEVFEFVRQQLERRFFRQDALASPEDVKRYLIAELAREDRELFVAIFLDNRHRPLALEKLFSGTIDSCSVHPREVVKRALAHNAAAAIFAHNHPSGVPEPSASDRALTNRLKEALALAEVRVLDHIIIIGGAEAVSLAERGMI
jgi:DNA repair protein RadC